MLQCLLGEGYRIRDL
jgi:hypothetical protein